MGDRDIAPHIVNCATRWKWIVRFMPWLLYPWGKSTPPVPTG